VFHPVYLVFNKYISKDRITKIKSHIPSSDVTGVIDYFSGIDIFIFSFFGDIKKINFSNRFRLQRLRENGVFIKYSKHIEDTHGLDTPFTPAAIFQLHCLVNEKGIK
jgi:hypothetical protein